MIGDKRSLLLLCGIILVYSSFVVSAAGGAAVLSTPVAYGNYTTWIFFNCASATENALNASLVYNASEGAVNTTNFLTTVTNTTANQSFFNVTVSVASLTDAGTYNITCRLENRTDIVYAPASVNVTIDNTAPIVSSPIINTTDYANFSNNPLQKINFTVTVSDALLGVGSVYFNITNSTGDQVNWSVGRASGSLYYNDFNASSYADGSYIITVTANDSYVNNTVNSSIHFRIDRTAPSTPSISRTYFGRTWFTLTGSASDATTGILSCTVDRSGATITRLTSSTWNISETSLLCSTNYNYVINCTDYMNNGTLSTTYTFSTDACAGGSSGSGGGSTTTTQWMNTYVVENSDFANGYSKQLAAKQRMRVSLGSETHYVGVTSLTATSATIEVSSDPVTVNLDVGGEKKLDLNSDGYYDILVQLLDITNNKANVKIQQISEAVPEGESSATEGQTSGEPATSTGDMSEGETESNLAWLWWVIGIVIVLVIVGLVVIKKKK